MNKIYIGVDVAKAKVDGALWLNEQSQKLGVFSNEPAGFEQLAQSVAQVAPIAESYHLVLEPTGGYELALVAFAHQQGWLVSLPNPKQVRDWAKGQGRRAKTDQLDAAMLAQYGAQQQPLSQPELPQALQQLESLLARQQDLQQLLRQEQNRQHALEKRPVVAEPVRQSLEHLTAILETELSQIEQAIAALIKSQADWATKLRLLHSVSGVGPKIAPHLLALLLRWDLVTAGQGSPKALTAHLGLDPTPFDSGSSVHKRPAISKMGDPHLRKLLFMGALGGVRGHNPLRAFYQALVGRGKAKKLALVAAARKILIWAWAVFRSASPFDPKKIDPNFI
jgi:transposase